MIELETNARIRAVQFPAGSMAQTDVQSELAVVGVTAKLYDGEYVGGTVGWQSMSVLTPNGNRWCRWVHVDDWVVLVGTGDDVLAVMVLTDDEYQAMFRAKRDHHAVVRLAVEAIIGSATGDERHLSWASDMPHHLTSDTPDRLNIDIVDGSMDVRQLVEDVLRAARA